MTMSYLLVCTHSMLLLLYISAVSIAYNNSNHVKDITVFTTVQIVLITCGYL